MTHEKFVLQFIDKFGCLDKKPGDGGDSCVWDFMYGANIAFMSPEKRKEWPLNERTWVDYCIAVHNPAPGILIRHPDPTKDASDWDRGSRDQTIPFLVCLSAWGWHRSKIWEYFKAHAKRFFFFHNTRQNGANKRNHGLVKNVKTGELYDYSPKTPDISGPEIFGIFIRGLRLWWFYPLLFVCDLFTVGGATIKAIKGPKDNIVFNHELIVRHSQRIYPTGLGHLCHLILTPRKTYERMLDHINDFGGPEKTMQFFVPMFVDVERGKK